MSSSISNSYRLISLPRITDPRGNLTFIQNPDQIPFDIKRIFLTYDVPGGEKRGGHAYKVQQEVIVALSGSFDVVILNNDKTEDRIILNRSYNAIYLPPFTWRYIENFSTNALSLHLCNSEYDESDYIRNFDDFLRSAQDKYF